MLHCFPVWQILHGAITTRCFYCVHTHVLCFLWRSDWKVSVIIQLRLMLSAGLSIDNPFIYEQLGLLLHSTYSHLLEIRSNTEVIFFLLYQRIEGCHDELTQVQFKLGEDMFSVYFNIILYDNFRYIAVLQRYYCRLMQLLLSRFFLCLLQQHWSLDFLKSIFRRWQHYIIVLKAPGNYPDQNFTLNASNWLREKCLVKRNKTSLHVFIQVN